MSSASLRICRAIEASLQINSNSPHCLCRYKANLSSNWYVFALLTSVCPQSPRVAGFIPPPLIFGMGIDSTCLFWSTVCGEKGACMLYDNVAYRHLYVSIAIVLKSSAFLLYTTTWQCLRKNYRKYIKNSDGYLTPTELFASNVTLDNLGKEISQNPVTRTKFIYNLEDAEMCDNLESVL